MINNKGRDMSVTILKCTACGYKLSNNADDQVAICEACGSEFLLEMGRRLGELDDSITNKLANLRQIQAAACDANDIKNLSKSSRDILTIVVDDYVSKYYYAYAENVLGNNRYISAFYESDAVDFTSSDMAKVLAHISKHSDLRDRADIESYIMSVDGIDIMAELSAYKSEFARRKSLEDNYDDIPRDVFVCHRSTDNIIALSVVNALERDGHKCWISSRNLRPNDVDNYWDNIKNAIDSCRIFLVVSSEDAMLSKDVKTELNIAKSIDKHRLEYKIDRSEHTSLFNAFFDGKMWVEGFENNARELAVLCNRVYREIDVINNVSRKSKFDEVDEIKELLKKQAAASVASGGKSSSVNVPNLIKKATMLIESSEFTSATHTLERISEEDVECADLWWLRLFVKFKVPSYDMLSNIEVDFDREMNYINAIKFCTDKEKRNLWLKLPFGDGSMRKKANDEYNLSLEIERSNQVAEREMHVQEVGDMIDSYNALVDQDKKSQEVKNSCTLAIRKNKFERNSLIKKVSINIFGLVAKVTLIVSLIIMFVAIAHGTTDDMFANFTPLFIVIGLVFSLILGRMDMNYTQKLDPVKSNEQRTKRAFCKYSIVTGSVCCIIDLINAFSGFNKNKAGYINIKKRLVAEKAIDRNQTLEKIDSLKCKIGDFCILHNIEL